MTDDRTYYLKESGSFYAGANGAVAYAPDARPGFTPKGSFSDGNYVKYYDTNPDYPGYVMIWFHAHVPTANNWSYFNVKNKRVSPESPEDQYEFNKSRTFTFDVYYEDDGYLDVYFFRNEYELNFHENGGPEVEDKKLYYETPLTAYQPSNYEEGVTTRRNSDGRLFVFNGWYTDSAMTEKFTSFDIPMPYYDIDLYAKWDPIQYTVAFDSNGGSAVPAQTRIEYGQSVARPADPTREGYDFIGWTLDGKPYSFSSKVSHDIILVAQWAQASEYTVKYDLNGGKGTTPTDANKYFGGAGAQVKELPAGVVGPKETPVFLGWIADSDGELYYPNSVVTMPAANLKLTAKWGKEGDTTVYRLFYNLKPLFDKCGVTYSYTGAEYRQINVLNNQRVKLPENYSVPAGFSSKFKFEGWYRDAACTDGPVTEMQVDLENESSNNLYAKWSRTYTITYDTNGGLWTDTNTGENRSETYSVTQSGVKIAGAPVKDGYEFIEWKGSSYQPGDTYHEKDSDGFLGDDTLVAQWKNDADPDDDDDDDDEGDSSKGVKTGDDNNLKGWVALLLLGAAGVGGAAVYRRKRRDDQ